MAKSTPEVNLQEEIIDVCLRRGIIFPSAEIYSGKNAAGFFEYGPVGNSVRENIIDLWKEAFINSEDNVYLINGSIILPEAVFEASGHLESFHDPLIQCEKCKSMYRLDHLTEEQLNQKTEGLELDEMYQVIIDNNITCPNCKGKLRNPRYFNMMFKTNISPVEGIPGYLRPETAQNIFLNFRRIAHSMRATLPFGIAQVGKVFRNEISARNFLGRMREFEQMELEMFVDPTKLNSHPNYDEIEDLEIFILTREAQLAGNKPEKMSISKALEKGIILNQYLAYYVAKEYYLLQDLGIDTNKVRFRHLMPEETAHYSSANYDLEIEFPFGIVECIGLAYRTDYDLKKHQEYSKTKMHIDENGQKIIPHVIEPSMGVDRLLYATLISAYQKGNREWTWFKFPYSLSPWEVLVTPLMKKDGLAEEAENIFWMLKDVGIDVIFDKTGAIGKRYARNDEIGVPFAITVDYQSFDDETVTIRDRDTTEQLRVPIEEVGSIIRELVLEMVTWDELKEEFNEIEGKKTQQKSTKSPQTIKSAKKSNPQKKSSSKPKSSQKKTSNKKSRKK